MLLSHLGYCSLGKEQTTGSDLPEIFNLDGTDINFQDQLQLLDSLPTRTFSYASIFYVKANQTSSKAILNNANLDAQLDENFYMFVHSLGSIVDVNDLGRKRNLLNTQPNKVTMKFLNIKTYVLKLVEINHERTRPTFENLTK